MADDLSGWLRRMRPPTAADDGWADTPDGDNALTAIQHRITRARTARRARRWMLLPAVTVAATAMAVLIAAAVSTPITETTTHPGTGSHGIALRPAAQLLTPFASCNALLTGLRAHAVAHPDAFMRNYPIPVDSRLGHSVNVPEASTGLDAGSNFGTSGQTSTTNVQEIGVDEPDIVKTDGDRVLTVTDGVLRVIGAASHAVTGKLDLTLYSGWEGARLLASGNSAVVLLGSSYPRVVNGGPVIEGPAIGAGGGPIGSPTGIASSTPSTAVLYVDLAGARPIVVTTMQVAGSIVDARMVGTTVRLVASSAPNLVLPTRDYGKPDIKTAVSKTPLSAWLPTYTVGNATHAVPCADVSHPKDYTAASMLTIYTLDPTHPGADPQPVSLAADGDTVYATTTSLYLASNPSCAWCYGTPTRSSLTEIHRFDITGTGKPTYLGSGSVPGSLLDQYSMSDYGGNLRVATTQVTAQSYTDGVNRSGPIAVPGGVPDATPIRPAETNGVSVLDDQTLKVVGSVSGLGNGEQIYAVRFLANLGYIVTFRQFDPLYVLDLSNPHLPRVVGSLQLPGYSSYLHDLGDGRLLGVGQDISQGEGAGLLVQLFDVSNPAAPKRIARETVASQAGRVQLDPHAFLWWQPTGLVVVPIPDWSSGAAHGNALALRVSGHTLAKLGPLTNETGSGAAQDNTIQRSMIVDGSLWTFSASGIRVSDQTSLAQQAWINFG